jgi:DNA invertase Pin-like site-specific DNA recombinase
MGSASSIAATIRDAAALSTCSSVQKGDNNQDCRSKGRHGYGKLPFGQDNNTAKLTDEQVRDLRRRYAAGERLAKLARELGINRSTALRAATGKAWRHLG